MWRQFEIDVYRHSIIHDSLHELVPRNIDTVQQGWIKNKFSLLNHKENYLRTVFPNIIFLRQ